MRKFSQRNSRSFQKRSTARGWLFGLMLAIATFPGCGGGGASSGIYPPPPPTISVVITPPSGNVLLGKTLAFSAAVSGTSNNSVGWSVNEIAGGSSAAGTITPEGGYQSPPDL